MPSQEQAQREAPSTTTALISLNSPPKAIDSVIGVPDGVCSLLCRDWEVGHVCVCAHRLSFPFPRGVHGWGMHTGSGAVGFGGLLDLLGQVLPEAGSGSQVFQAEEHGCAPV